MKNRLQIFLLFILINQTFFGTQSFGNVIVSVASNFSKPILDIKKEFEKVSKFSHHKIKIVFGSSGKIYSQIKNNAPFDIFLSADKEKPDLLYKEGLVEDGFLYTYAIGRIALVASDKNIMLENMNFDHNIKASMANPKLAPYGLAAIEALKSFKKHKKMQNNIIMGENISQAFQFLFTKSVDIGIVALSQIRALPEGHPYQYWIIPEQHHSPIEQVGVLLKRAKLNKAAVDFFNFLKSEKAKDILRKYGYR